MQFQAGLAELAHRPHEHPGPEVRAADAEVDNVGDGPAVGAFKGAALHFIHETAHALASAAHVGHHVVALGEARVIGAKRHIDRKSTRLNSSHGYISYAVFCLKKKKKKNI